jgi:hypothetical protein
MSSKIGRAQTAPAGSKKPKTESSRAKAFLKSAIDNGTIDELLWEEVALVQKPETNKDSIDNMEADIFLNDISLWNSVLTARVMHTRSDLLTQQEEKLKKLKSVEILSPRGRKLMSNPGNSKFTEISVPYSDASPTRKKTRKKKDIRINLPSNLPTEESPKKEKNIPDKDNMNFFSKTLRKPRRVIEIILEAKSEFKRRRLEWERERAEDGNEEEGEYLSDEEVSPLLIFLFQLLFKNGFPTFSRISDGKEALLLENHNKTFTINSKETNSP